MTRNSHKGFTLIELLVTLSVSTLLLTLLSVTFVSVSKMNQNLTLDGKTLSEVRSLLSYAKSHSDCLFYGGKENEADSSVYVLDSDSSKSVLFPNEDGRFLSVNTSVSDSDLKVLSIKYVYSGKSVLTSLTY